MIRDTGYVLDKRDWMRAERIWSNGPRYLWTDAFGVVLYVSLYRALGEERWLDQAERLVADVERVLGRPRGLRIGEAADRDGQYYHYLAMWLFALARLGEHRPAYRARGISIARGIHPAFVVPGRGVWWKMLPHGFPRREIVLQQTRRSLKAGVFEAMMHDPCLCRSGDTGKEPAALSSRA